MRHLRRLRLGGAPLRQPVPLWAWLPPTGALDVLPVGCAAKASALREKGQRRRSWRRMIVPAVSFDPRSPRGERTDLGQPITAVRPDGVSPGRVGFRVLKRARRIVLCIALPASLPRRVLPRIALGVEGTRRRVRVRTHFLATPLGKIIMSEGKIPQSAEISAENIIRPSFDDLSAEQRGAYEALKKQRQEKRQEEFMAQQKKREEEDMEAHLANFKKERQGGAIQLGEINLPPVLGESAEPSKSTRGDEMKWRPKSPCAEISESSKQQENSTNVSSVIIGTQELKLKEPVVVDEPANSKKVILTIPPRSSANDHEASTSKAKPRDPKYTQPKWCPLGLTKTKKRRLQRMRNQEKVEHTAEKQRDEVFDKTHLVPYKKWVLKKVEGAAVPMTIATTTTSSEEKDVNIDELTTPLPTTPDSVPISEDDEELVDFENSPAREGMDMNMVYYLPSEFRAVDEEGEVAQLDFGPKNAIFEKPKEPVKHLKPLYVKGHINGSPVARMLVDGGAVVNLMPYSVFKKLGLDENDLMKTNMVLNGFEGKEKTETKGVMSVELTVGSKSLATAFFIAEVQGKKGSNKLRLCIDFRDLNRATPKDEYPMPIADMLINDASGHKVISFIDGNAGYNQIFMAEEDAFKTAFRCPGFVGLFEWTVMTFGLKECWCDISEGYEFNIS
ncbi:hypothetical protein QYE76_056373 [Lolium multiflorum]|uniref:Reverse transcriptase domain-containing protein n=1 Tax=Lolium multiflorum TaxID=4521 RepID=A0AAD8WMS0_LOLMU|nr:hypothetical protein QYE76_056373 [Lolium multiflorum]